ncbi:hypothetical protein KVT40_004025 [Elsinoe batatas]|uniref:BTB domain-containing protein n=1 Tax=Elsinoe batatas TaxID=2601811 RepID=A0A8K0L367_9PEZI|nr:hypothetical protein KVT40_004025 [Elsinoe batatas]
MGVTNKDPWQVDSSLFDSEVLSDITVISSDKKIRAHKLLLLSQSLYFKTLFTGGFKDSKMSELTLGEDSAAAIYAMIQYMYTGVLAIATEKLEWNEATLLIDLLIVADKYQVNGLSQTIFARLVEILEKNDSPDPVFAALASLPTHLLDRYAKELALVLLERIKEHMSWKSFRSMLDTHGMLAREIVGGLLKRPAGKARELFEYTCSHCGNSCGSSHDFPLRPIPACGYCASEWGLICTGTESVL